ncbi:MAG: peptide ABC transporter substrate-binding protein, partial [Dehalococcoidia bacterium]|nr:peptide ABC transporter substrate-binding protein [Dehalococcoidia bacterium]
MKRVLRVPLIIAMVGLLIIAGAVGALALTIQTETEPDRGGSYVEGVVGAPISPNPVLASFNDADRDIASLVFTGLARLNERGEPIPELARQWQVGADGKTVVIALRRDAHWHDGAPFGALDVLYTVRTIQSPKFPGPPDLAEAWKGITVEAIDDYTVRFRLRDSFAPFLMNLTVGMLPSHLLRDVPPDALPDHPFRSNPIGTGPFKVREATSESVTLEANPGFYGEKPYLRTIKFQFYPNRSALLSALKTREVTAAANVTTHDLTQIGKQRDYTVYTAPRASYIILFLNHASPYFRDRAVRQALAYALDRQRVVDTAVRGLGVVADTPIPPGSWAAITTTKRYDFNPTLAAKMLDDAGWRMG